MAEIVRVYRQSVGAMRFIGKKYGDDDRVNGMFGAKWDEWFNNGWFDVIEACAGGNLAGICEDGDALIGLMRGGHAEPFEYWIGRFAQENAAVPEGFEHIDFLKSELGVCWVYGREEDVYCLEGQCGERLKKEGFEAIGGWCFERYARPRFTEPDENGNVTLDICFYIK